MATYTRLAEAPDHFPALTADETGEIKQVKVGDTFEAELSDDEERAVVAAGWAEPAGKSATTKGKGA